MSLFEEEPNFNATFGSSSSSSSQLPPPPPVAARPPMAQPMPQQPMTMNRPPSMPAAVASASSSASRKWSGGKIAAVVIGVLLGIGIVVAIVVIVITRNSGSGGDSGGGGDKKTPAYDWQLKCPASPDSKCAPQCSSDKKGTYTCTYMCVDKNNTDAPADESSCIAAGKNKPPDEKKECVVPVCGADTYQWNTTDGVTCEPCNSTKTQTCTASKCLDTSNEPPTDTDVSNCTAHATNQKQWTRACSPTTTYHWRVLRYGECGMKARCNGASDPRKEDDSCWDNEEDEVVDLCATDAKFMYPAYSCYDETNNQIVEDKKCIDIHDTRPAPSDCHYGSKIPNCNDNHYRMYPLRCLSNCVPPAPIPGLELENGQIPLQYVCVAGTDSVLDINAIHETKILEDKDCKDVQAVPGTYDTYPPTLTAPDPGYTWCLRPLCKTADWEYSIVQDDCKSQCNRSASVAKCYNFEGTPNTVDESTCTDPKPADITARCHPQSEARCISYGDLVRWGTESYPYVINGHTLKEAYLGLSGCDWWKSGTKPEIRELGYQTNDKYTNAYFILIPYVSQNKKKIGDKLEVGDYFILRTIPEGFCGVSMNGKPARDIAEYELSDGTRFLGHGDMHVYEKKKKNREDVTGSKSVRFHIRKITNPLPENEDQKLITSESHFEMLVYYGSDTDPQKNSIVNTKKDNFFDKGITLCNFTNPKGCGSQANNWFQPSYFFFEPYA